ncbi:MAG: cysteine--tRNA ligase [Gammaproteobacteria bacterium]|nr:cysteine--tRNA ligase [Gammaproteobacteria bacterium]MCP5136081.1 cysteine--tRNA ligase [Gammaproteobacteria bacterium]
MLQVYNTLSKSKETFTPIEPGKVRMYVCGMTVYDYCHLGHARVMVVFDVITRYLRHRGYDVTYVRNVTDIDDKIINRANENGEPFHALTTRFIDAMHEDSDALGVIPPDIEPKATDSIPEILAMVQTLIDKGHAYVGPKNGDMGGDVYYDVSTFATYGKLSGKDPADLRAGERIAVNEAKTDPLDFVLWKAAKPGEPSWESPWGAGRPGWHIECSAMSTHELGDHFDIHGGGMDLTFPHHENEIAQSEGATGHPFVNYWLHNGFVRINEEKMSKSLGNFFTVREILARYQAEVVRYFILTSQYRSPLNYDEEHLENAKGALTRFYTALRGLADAEPARGGELEARFDAAMDDDFNTPEALAVLFELARSVNKAKEEGRPEAAALGALLKKLAGVLGLLQGDPEAYLKGGESEGGLSSEQVEALIAARNQARAERNWAEADRLRDELAAARIVLEDGAGGTTWRRG